LPLKSRFKQSFQPTANPASESGEKFKALKAMTWKWFYM